MCCRRCNARTKEPGRTSAQTRKNTASVPAKRKRRHSGIWLEKNSGGWGGNPGRGVGLLIHSVALSRWPGLHLSGRRITVSEIKQTRQILSEAVVQGRRFRRSFRRQEENQDEAMTDDAVIVLATGVWFRSAAQSANSFPSTGQKSGILSESLVSPLLTALRLTGFLEASTSLELEGTEKKKKRQSRRLAGRRGRGPDLTMRALCDVTEGPISRAGCFSST